MTATPCPSAAICCRESSQDHDGRNPSCSVPSTSRSVFSVCTRTRHGSDSDISPLRKKDPGEKFPWRLLYKKKLSIWHNLSERNCKEFRKIKLDNNINFYKLLFKFGYKYTNNSSDKIKILKNFQRRFRPELISSIVDKECYLILKSLIYLS